MYAKAYKLWGFHSKCPLKEKQAKFKCQFTVILI